MICFKCGAEIPEGSTICPVCHADLTLEFAQTDPQETGSASGGSRPALGTDLSSGSLPSVPEEPKPGKKGMKILIAAGVVAAAGAAAAFAFTQMNAKDPKEAVVDAFQTTFSHEQVSPAEDIFGLSQFSSASVSSDAEAGLTLSLDSSSMEELNALTGGGLRISSRNDVSNKKSDANVGVVYNGMDVVNLDLYYGDHTLMAAIPELSEKVLTMDLGDGLADRIKNYVNNEELLQNKLEYLRLWFRKGWQYPGCYLRAFLDNTYQAWYPGTSVVDDPDGDIYYFDFEGRNVLEMKTISSRLTEFYRKISLEYYYQKIPVIRALFAIGTYFWLAVILFFYGIRRRRAEIWNSWLLVLALCLTVFLGPISLVRYYLLLFYAAPAGIFLLADRP